MDKKGDLNLVQIRYIYENALENIIILDNECKILSVNQSYIFGYTNSDELIGKRIFTLTNSTNNIVLQQIISNSANNIRSNEIHEVAINKPKGGKIWYEIKCLPHNSENDEIYYIIFARNITKRKNLENQLKKTNQNLVEIIDQKTHHLKEAISDLESFSYSVSHDLKAPLRAIKGYSSILNEELGVNTNIDVSDAIKSITRNIDKMDKLIADISKFSKIGRIETTIQPINIQQIFLGKYQELTLLEPNRKITFSIDENIPRLLFDQAMAKQVAQNLLSNALKYTSKKKLAEITIGYVNKRNEVILYIQDNGAGFDNRFKDKLFGVFQRLHSENEFPGTGVGLAIVKRIINKHGGHIWGEAKVDNGATFYISLPKKLIYHEK